MWIALSLIKSIQHVVCSLSLFFEGRNESGYKKFCQSGREQLGVRETESCRMAACFCSRILTDLKYQTGPCWFDVLKYSTMWLWKKPLASSIYSAGIGLVWVGGGQMRRLVIWYFKTRQQTSLSSACPFQRVNPRGGNIRDIFTSSGNN